MFNDFVFSRLQLFQSRDEGFRQVTARQCELRSITVSTNGLDNLITRYQLATLRAYICPAWQYEKLLNPGTRGNDDDDDDDDQDDSSADKRSPYRASRVTAG